MNELSLFSGAGLGLLGTKLLGFRCVGYVEKDDYCKRVLRARIRDGYLDDAPIFDDVRTFDGRPYRGRVDCVTAGFPCQPFSVAARGRNIKMSLSAETLRVVRDVKPRFVFLENVYGAASELWHMARILEADGYKTQAIKLSAADVGAPHIRSRLWLLADAYGNSESALSEHEKMARLSSASGAIWTDVIASDLRMDDGRPSRMDRLRAIGNGQCPRVVIEAWRRLSA